MCDGVHDVRFLPLRDPIVFPFLFPYPHPSNYIQLPLSLSPPPAPVKSLALLARFDHACTHKTQEFELLIKSEERENGLDLLSLESSITMAYKTIDIKGEKKGGRRRVSSWKTSRLVPKTIGRH